MQFQITTFTIPALLLSQGTILARYIPISEIPFLISQYTTNISTSIPNTSTAIHNTSTPTTNNSAPTPVS